MKTNYEKDDQQTVSKEYYNISQIDMDMIQDLNNTGISQEIIVQTQIPSKDEINSKVEPKKEKLSNPQYKSSDSGPFIVWVMSNTTSQNISNLHPLKLGKLLYNTEHKNKGNNQNKSK